MPKIVPRDAAAHGADPIPDSPMVSPIGRGWRDRAASKRMKFMELGVVARDPTLLLVQAIDSVDPVPVQASQIPPNLPPEARRSVRVLKLEPLQRNPL